MALHRDIYWVGRQWAVTGSGIQACDQKQKGKFDIEAGRLWEDGVLESVRALKWLNMEDFEKAIAVARKYYPEPPRKARPPEASAARLRDGGPKERAPKDRVTKVIVAKDNVTRENVSKDNVTKDGAPIEFAKEPPKPVQKFELRIEGLRAKFVPVWRIRHRGRLKNE